MSMLIHGFAPTIQMHDFSVRWQLTQAQVLAALHQVASCTVCFQILLQQAGKGVLAGRCFHLERSRCRSGSPNARQRPQQAARR